MATDTNRTELTAIAREHLGLETLETRNMDSLDFHDLGVAGVADALEAAYEAGVASVAAAAYRGALERDADRYNQNDHSIELARDRYRGNWDQNGTTSVHLPTDVAERLLAERGWDRGANGHTWISPSADIYYDTAEALQIALTAENA